MSERERERTDRLGQTRDLVEARDLVGVQLSGCDNVDEDDDGGDDR